MIVCKVCGHENEAGAGFCGSCGAFLEWSGEAVPADETTAMAVPGPVPVPVPEPGPAAPEPGPVTPEPDDATAVLPVVDLPPTHAAAAPGTLVCPACGLANEPTRVYCRRCATELAARGRSGHDAVHASRRAAGPDPRWPCSAGSRP